MPVAWKVEHPCPQYNDDSDVWLFEKDEPTVIKECYTCKSCDAEWIEITKKEDRDW